VPITWFRASRAWLRAGALVGLIAYLAVVPVHAQSEPVPDIAGTWAGTRSLPM
jgi:hypothetical protein